MIVAREKPSYDFQLPLPEDKTSRQSRQRQLNTVKSLKRSLIVMVLAVFTACMLVSYYYAQVYTLGYRLDSLKQKVASLQSEQQVLSDEVNQVDSLDYIEAVATKELGMVKPNQQSAVMVSLPPAGLSPGQNVVPKEKTYQVAGSHNPFIQVFYQLISKLQKKIKTG